MADNTQLNVGSGGDVIATDDIGGIKYQRVKTGFGVDGAYSDVSATTPLPVNSNAADNTQLYSGSITTTGPLSGLDTTGYASVAIQLSGSWSGNIIIEGSGNNSVWNNLIVLNANELSMQDVINAGGNYILKTSTKWIRINVLDVIDSIVTLVIGRTVAGINAVDSLSFAMDKSNNTPLYVEDIAGALKRDANNALMPSDAPKPIEVIKTLVGAGSLAIIDTAGYQSISIHAITMATTISIQTGNTIVSTFNTSVSGIGGSSNSASVSISNTGVWMYPCTGRYINMQGLGSGLYYLVIYLRQQPVNILAPSGVPINIQTINGTSPISAGVGGTFGIGGIVGPGSSNSGVNPVLIAGSDIGNLNRRLLTDTSGRLITSVTDQLGTARPIGSLSPTSNPYNVASLSVQDLSLTEGFRIGELLAFMLIELRVLTEQMKTIPNRIFTGVNDTTPMATLREAKSDINNV